MTNWQARCPNYPPNPSYSPNTLPQLSSLPSSIERATVTCYNCSGMGHLAKVCPSPRIPRTQRPTSNHSCTSNSNKPWLMDSGTTHHLTADLDNLHLYSEYQGLEEVVVGFPGYCPSFGDIIC
ncbi:hypothetical protein ACH5RR_029563 [Cinchona calisaya]|uniref:CCHC-type domain-containing protein n=1 Tax=Cinchona calisaya TaxID=153742 RepID=A0ABD2YS16_9GENT